MKTYLRFPNPGDYRSLRQHLLPPCSRLEQAAFLYAKTRPSGSEFWIDVIAVEKLTAADFALQLEYHLELQDAARARVIKRAHDLRAALIEIHSHPSPFPAAFSASDIAGLRETVPNIMWRLKGRPYCALVAAPSGFDGLVWHESARAAEQIQGVWADGFLHPPSGLSLGDW